MMQDKHAERMARARIELPDPKKGRTHAQRMAAATGQHVYGDHVRLANWQRRQLLKHRNEAE